MYGWASFPNKNNFRGRNYTSNRDRNDFGATANFSNNVARFEGHNNAPTSHVGASQAHDNNRRNIRERNYNPRSSGHGFVQNGVYHCREIVNSPNTGAIEPGRSQGGNVQEGAVSNAPRAMQGRRNENSDVLSNSQPEISNFVNNIDTITNQGN